MANREESELDEATIEYLFAIEQALARDSIFFFFFFFFPLNSNTHLFFSDVKALRQLQMNAPPGLLPVCPSLFLLFFLSTFFLTSYADNPRQFTSSYLANSNKTPQKKPVFIFPFLPSFLFLPSLALSLLTPPPPSLKKNSSHVNMYAQILSDLRKFVSLLPSFISLFLTLPLSLF